MQQQENFWDFSVRIYRKPGVADACLALQDGYGVDVNVLLYCCWYGCTRGPLDGPALRQVLSFAEPWADRVVRPLRAARRWMKTTGCTDTVVARADCMQLRQKIKQIELEAEQLQQDTLQELTWESAPKKLEIALRRDNTLLNINMYLRYLGVYFDSASQPALAKIVSAASSGSIQRHRSCALAQTVSGESSR